MAWRGVVWRGVAWRGVAAVAWRGVARLASKVGSKGRVFQGETQSDCDCETALTQSDATVGLGL